jgi:hypothetical protein
LEYFWFYLATLFVWFLFSLASASQVATQAVKAGKDEWGGVSFLPGLLIMPIAATLIAWLINIKWGPVGFWVVGLLHACYGIGALGYFLYTMRYMKRNRKRP